MSVTVSSYVVNYDLGFAPNPFHGVCTLATCKPFIRKRSKEGDYVIGTGSRSARKPGQGGRAVFIMRVTELSDFNRYWDDPRFQIKKPDLRGSLFQQYGDNIYWYDSRADRWHQANSRHSLADGTVSPKDLKTDTSHTRKVLISTDFTYWGGNGPLLPSAVACFATAKVREKCHYSSEEVDRFVAWAAPLLGQGCVGEPYDWDMPRKRRRR